jgi:RNA polymerase-binding transcription factor
MALSDMALSRARPSQLARNLDQPYESLLAEVRDAFEKSENQQYVELIGRVPGDIGDESVADALADLNLALIDRQIQELRDIDAARARMKNHSYGICMGCGDDIGFERLRRRRDRQRGARTGAWTLQGIAELDGRVEGLA